MDNANEGKFDLISNYLIDLLNCLINNDQVINLIRQTKTCSKNPAGMILEQRDSSLGWRL